MYVRKFQDLKERRKKCFVLIDLKVCTLTHQEHREDGHLCALVRERGVLDTFIKLNIHITTHRNKNDIK